MLRPQFARQQYQDLDIFKEHVDNLIACIPSDGKPVDLQPLFFRFTLDTTSAFLFGESTFTLKGDDSKDGRSFAQSFDTAQDYVVKRFRLLDLYWLIGGSKFHKACNDTHAFIDSVISNRGKAREKSTRYLFFDAVAEDSADVASLRGQLLNILLAGRDTTACLLSWTLSVPGLPFSVTASALTA